MVNSRDKADKVIELLFKEEDFFIFNSLFSNTIEELLNVIEDWEEFFSVSKHCVSSYDYMGYTVLRSMIITKIFEFDKSEKGLYDFSFGKELKNNGFVVWEDYQLFNPLLLKELGEFANILTGQNKNLNISPSLFVSDWTKSTKQTYLHIDALSPVFKLFYYLKDVKIESGPYVYVPRSQNISLDRMKMIKDSSILRSSDPSLDASLRVCSKNIEYFSSLETPFTYKANTLILTNTSGLHRRQLEKPGFSRFTLRHNFGRGSLGDI